MASPDGLAYRVLVLVTVVVVKIVSVVCLMKVPSMTFATCGVWHGGFGTVGRGVYAIAVEP